MSKENNGGYIYPRQLPDIEVSPSEALEMIERYSGMTLRDYFAGQALGGLSATAAEPNCPSMERMAIMSYEQADAMLAAREA